MGRWTPLILMAGGVAILLGTLIGINFPMPRQQTANVPSGRRASEVLPANINVNSSATGNDPQTNTQNDLDVSGNDDLTDENRRSVAQNNASTGSTSTAQNTEDISNTDNSGVESSSSSSQNKQPIRALW
ncbi:hypothetical protein VB711_02420 [Cronbergia sp. UHCC 0137]|uniref:hypothetical protein n=1 Tax=Cronbergia sp. UHCC 0137 TaxID=3110239 RepID=UPI002B217B2A|nr:hypothetical protein [Cronbergia sp. UHCC 0137]MEA5616697.1 hypothetical protein [Cronbergia sp. UHCC 0137]